MSDVVSRLNEALAGRYRIERELGEGGMATVYLAHDLKHKRDVAVKVLKPEIAGVAEARFQREIEIAARLTHPHLVPLHDSGDAGGLRYFVMPVITGGSLAELIDGPLDPTLVLDQVRAIASGLDYAHREGIVHRDLKPANVLVHEGEVMISDMGIALDRTEAADARFTQTGSSIGTPSYMSPEQVEGTAELDARSDVYALGCMAFEMLTGTRPFTAETGAALAARILSDPPPKASATNAELPRAVDDVLTRAMAKRPNERYASAGELAGALEAALAPRPSTMTGRTGAAVATAAVAFIAAVFLWQAGEQRDREAALARLQLVDSLVEAGAWAEAFFESRGLTHPDVVDEVAALEPRYSEVVTVTTDPAGATLLVRPYASPDQRWLPLGTTPLEVALPTKVAALRLEREGFEPVEVNRDAFTMSALGGGMGLPLLPLGTTPSGMVHVPSGEVDLGAYQAGLWGVEPLTIGSYFIDRLEVTNAQYAEFVNDGGYADPQYWPAEMEVDGRVIGPADVSDTFVDQTGQPGPATWDLGAPPEGREDHPVTGVSWFEARAYARFAGKRLPTLYHWRRAVGAWDTEHIVTRSNLAGDSTVTVGSTEGVSEYGLSELAGNAREWISNTDGDLPITLGGGFDDAVNRFFDTHPQPAWDRSVSNGFRLMLEPEDTTGMLVADAPIPVPRRDFGAESPAPDSEFAFYLRLFEYDPVELEPRIESADTTADWVRQEITFETGFTAERMKVHLYLPIESEPQSQVVVFFPGSGVLRTTQPLEELSWVGEEFNFLVKTGRAVALPVLLGSMDRADGFRYRLQDDTRSYSDHVIAWGKELARTLDYLETRDDLDSGSVGYYGFSWGARMGAIMMAVNQRLKAGVLHSGGLSPIPVRPEADPFNYLSRVTQPVLMLNSLHDNVYPYLTAAMPYFQGLGSPEGDKVLTIAGGGHFLDRNDLVKETLAWFDRHLGPVN